MPRRWTAVICVAFKDAGGAIVAVAPFYVAAPRKKGKGANAKVVTPRHYGVPRAGFVTSGGRLSEQLRAHEHAGTLVDMARRFTAATYDGALLLAALRKERPELAASVTAVDKTLANYEHHLKTYEGVTPAAPSTRLRSASVRTSTSSSSSVVVVE